MDYWSYLAIGVAVGAIAASLIAFIVSRRSASHIEMKRLQTQHDQLRSEYSEYKKQVRTHFSDTAVLLQNVNESHKQLYQSMASSVSSLCSFEDGGTPEALTQQIRALTEKAAGDEPLLNSPIEEDLEDPIREDPILSDVDDLPDEADSKKDG